MRRKSREQSGGGGQLELLPTAGRATAAGIRRRRRIEVIRAGAFIVRCP
jgi:hypothetical protein